MAISGARSRTPRRQEQRPLARVAAAPVNVLPGFGTRARREGHPPARERELLDGYHAVAAHREHRTGHDLDTVGGGSERQRRVAGGLRRLHAERARAGADRLAVDRHAIHATRSKGGWSRSA